MFKIKGEEMKKTLLLSFATAGLLYANESILLPSVDVESKVNTQVVKDVSSEEIKSADLAEALTQNIPSISLVRRSGIANDIILRGAKKDNINVILDHGKIYGACPNRMDPATSHVLTNNIESVEVIEGPYDVENFGTLSGLVNVKTKDPQKGFGGEVNVNYGSYSYEKYSASVYGGTDRFKVMLSASTESSDQYEDGNGHNFYEQQVANGTAASTSNEYSSANQDHEAYEKKTMMAKTVINVSDNSELKLSYTANRSDNVLYPNTPMDADYDDSNIYTAEYIIRDLGQYSDALNLEYYYSNVDHPMSVRLRDNAMMMKDMTNHMKSSIWGAKVKNGMQLDNAYLTLGLDTSVRNWRGRKFNSDLSTNIESLSDTDTTNRALFSKYEQDFGALNMQIGLRYDNTDVDVADVSKKDNDYDFFSGNIFNTYQLNESTKFFFGAGVSSRVPDARELYYTGTVGNEDLKETQNREFDIGLEKQFENMIVKSKFFYSDLKDYIYYKKGTGFQNIDASIYGVELSSMYMFDDEWYADAGIAYLRGEKDEALAGQTDKDLAEIPPLKANIGINYDNGIDKLRAEVIAAKSWSNYDSDNGEEELSGYGVFNIKYDRAITKSFDVIVGVDNVFDKTYATTNTYYDITYVTVGGEPAVINEPGRYAYINLRYTF